MQDSVERAFNLLITSINRGGLHVNVNVFRVSWTHFVTALHLIETSEGGGNAPGLMWPWLTRHKLCSPPTTQKARAALSGLGVWKPHATRCRQWPCTWGHVIKTVGEQVGGQSTAAGGTGFWLLVEALPSLRTWTRQEEFLLKEMMSFLEITSESKWWRNVFSVKQLSVYLQGFKENLPGTVRMTFSALQRVHEGVSKVWLHWSFLHWVWRLWHSSVNS